MSTEHQIDKPTIVGVDGVERSAWDTYVTGHKGASVYHRPVWTDILASVFGFHALHLFAIEGGSVRGFLPLFTCRGRRLTSSPFRDRGGLLADSESVASALLEGAVRSAQELKANSVEIKQCRTAYEDTYEKLGWRKEQYWIGSLVELPDDADEMFQRVNSKARGKVRQAASRGVKIVTPTDIQGTREFYELFWRTRRSLGVPTYPLSLFEAFAQRLCVEKCASFLLATAEGKCIGGMVLFSHRDVVIDAYAASSREALDLRPNDFLAWEAIKWAIVNGYRYFDFGADAPGQASLLQFKAKWTATQEPLSYFHYSVSGQAPPVPDPSSSFTARIARRVLPYLPGAIYGQVSRLGIRQLVRAI